jgi:hypothetical protein
MDHGQRPDDRSSPRRIEVRPGAARGAQPSGGVRLGKMTPYQPTPQPREAATAEGLRQPRQGFDLGQAKPQVSPHKEEADRARLRKLLFAAGGAIVVVIALGVILGSSANKGVILTNEDQKLLSNYKTYLKKKGASADAASAKAGEVERRLKAYRWALSVGERRSAEDEYTSLLLMDKDTGSPLYQYCVKELKQQ